MEYNYATIDNNGTVIGISTLSTQISRPDMILINNNSNINIGWRWIGGQWLTPLPIERIIEPIVPTNIQIAQTMMSISADLDIMNAKNLIQADSLSENSVLYQKWYDAYMTNQAALITLNRLVENDILRQDEVDIMIRDRNRLEQERYL